jgi:hypothetical protein
MKIVAIITTILATLIYLITTSLLINDSIGRSEKPGIHLYNFFIWYTIPIIMWVIYFVMNEIKKNNIKIPIFTDKNAKINTNIYYIQENGATSEALTYNQLKAKNIKKDTYVWRKGINWTKAVDLKELNTLFEDDLPPAFEIDKIERDSKTNSNQNYEIGIVIVIIVLAFLVLAKFTSS